MTPIRNYLLWGLSGSLALALLGLAFSLPPLVVFAGVAFCATLAISAGWTFARLSSGREISVPRFGTLQRDSNPTATRLYLLLLAAGVVLFGGLAVTTLVMWIASR